MSTAAARITPSITTMIRMDHSHALALFHRFKADAPPGKKRALVRNACLALEIHAQLEEEIFYPALRAVMAGDEVLEKSRPEHDEMRRLIGELRERVAGDAPVGDTSYDDLFLQLMRIVMHHVADEETRLLPAAERLLRDRLGELGLEMTKRRMELLKPHVGEIAASSIRSFPVGAAAGAVLVAGAVAVGTALLWRKGNGYRRWRM
ncbi:MAG TPA: hemerythrin domain-containing protein [Steroidobacteraceae bacterium]|jgi:hemerythrin superfamily protein